MAEHKPVEVNPKDIQRAQALWGNFTQAMKWGVIGTIVVLILLYVAFVAY